MKRFRNTEYLGKVLSASIMDALLLVVLVAWLISPAYAADTIPGYALDFDGVNDYVDAGDINAVDGISALTIEVYVKFDSLASYKTIVGKYIDDKRAGSILAV